MLRERKRYGWGIINKPYHIHGCTKCIFLFSLEMHIGKDNDMYSTKKYIDVYKSCSNGHSEPDETEYLLRYGKDSKYASGIMLDNFVAHWAIDSGIV